MPEIKRDSQFRICFKRDSGSIPELGYDNAIIAQKFLFVKTTRWKFNDEIHFLVRKWQKLVEKDNQAREFESEAYSHFWLHNCGYLNMNGAGLLFLEFDLQMTKTDQVW